MPGRSASYGKDFKYISVQVTPAEHQELRIKAAQHSVTVSDVFRAAMADDGIWRKAARLKSQRAKEA